MLVPFPDHILDHEDLGNEQGYAYIIEEMCYFIAMKAVFKAARLGIFLRDIGLRLAPSWQVHFTLFSPHFLFLPVPGEVCVLAIPQYANSLLQYLL